MGIRIRLNYISLSFLNKLDLCLVVLLLCKDSATKNASNLSIFSIAVQFNCNELGCQNVTYLFIAVGFMADFKLSCGKLSWERQLYSPLNSGNYFKGYIYR